MLYMRWLQHFWGDWWTKLSSMNAQILKLLKHNFIIANMLSAPLQNYVNEALIVYRNRSKSMKLLSIKLSAQTFISEKLLQYFNDKLLCQHATTPRLEYLNILPLSMSSFIHNFLVNDEVVRWICWTYKFYIFFAFLFF